MKREKSKEKNKGTNEDQNENNKQLGLENNWQKIFVMFRYKYTPQWHR